jgi:hypothetical protein
LRRVGHFASGRSIKQQTNNKQQANLTPPDSVLKVVGPHPCLSIEPLPGVNWRNLDEAGGVDYLKRLAIENSSAFSSLLGKVLPTTLQADESSGGLGTKITFERVIVMPDGQRFIEGVTPKALPGPSHALPNSGESNTDNSKINSLDD